MSVYFIEDQCTMREGEKIAFVAKMIDHIKGLGIAEEIQEISDEFYFENGTQFKTEEELFEYFEKKIDRAVKYDDIAAHEIDKIKAEYDFRVKDAAETKTRCEARQKEISSLLGSELTPEANRIALANEYNALEDEKHKYFGQSDNELYEAIELALLLIKKDLLNTATHNPNIYYTPMTPNFAIDDLVEMQIERLTGIKAVCILDDSNSQLEKVNSIMNTFKLYCKKYKYSFNVIYIALSALGVAQAMNLFNHYEESRIEHSRAVVRTMLKEKQEVKEVIEKSGLDIKIFAEETVKNLTEMIKQNEDLQRQYKQAFKSYKEGVILSFNILALFREALKNIKVQDFVNCYPHAKEYCGEEYSTKDYYSSKKCIEELLQESDTINEDNANTIISEYYPSNILLFMLQSKIFSLLEYKGANFFDMLERFLKESEQEKQKEKKNKFQVRRSKFTIIE